MSLATWTPAALSSERSRLAGACWRAVEAQHHVSTMKVVETLAEQGLLEEVLERAKPPLPPECRHLHYLLATPFRYGAPYPAGSRFRRPGFTPGVFYASSVPATAVAELAFHRLLFFADSPATPWPRTAGEYTVFSVKVRTMSGLDLTVPPLSADAERWTHPTDYDGCQALAERAREAGVEILRYTSARIESGRNQAVLTCRAFSSRQPETRQTWRLQFAAHGVRALCNSPEQRMEFDRAAFSRDPRIAGMRWER